MLSEDAEESCATIQHTLAAHHQAIIALSAGYNPPRRLPTRGVDRAQMQRQATLLRFLSITEAFCTERLFDEMNLIVNPQSHEAVGSIWSAAFDTATGTWTAQKEAFKNWLKVDKKLWESVIELTLARNAVAHGHGRLTHRQRRKNRADLERTLNRHNITLDCDQVVLSEASIASAAKTCRTFIEAIDSALRLAPTLGHPPRT